MSRTSSRSRGRLTGRAQWDVRRQAQDLSMNRFRRTHAMPRYAVCHRALRGTPLQVPAELLTTASVAEWVRRRGLGVDVSGAQQLRLALETGLPAARLAAQCPDASTVEAAMAAAV